jgi:16S rRNA (adenine1518-N6/adenine1519-N6)-dimethyltransferase
LLAVIRPEADELFIEIGSGTGQLTLPIAAAGAQVVAVEIDRELAAGLRRIAPSRVQVVTDDILSLDLVDLIADAIGSETPRPVRVVGNLPFNLASPILFRILGAQRAARSFRDATLMLQREVADRVVASPCSRAYGPLAILTRLAADARRVLSLPPGAFRPPPRVRAAVVTLDFRPPSISIADPALFERMVRSPPIVLMCFSSTSVTSSSTTSGLAPSSAVVTMATGRSIRGNWSTPSRSMPRWISP